MIRSFSSYLVCKIVLWPLTLWQFHYSICYIFPWNTANIAQWRRPLLLVCQWLWWYQTPRHPLCNFLRRSHDWSCGVIERPILFRLPHLDTWREKVLVVMLHYLSGGLIAAANMQKFEILFVTCSALPLTQRLRSLVGFMWASLLSCCLHSYSL
jgi:hypothetical protein